MSQLKKQWTQHQTSEFKLIIQTIICMTVHLSVSSSIKWTLQHLPAYLTRYT